MYVRRSEASTMSRNTLHGHVPVLVDDVQTIEEVRSVIGRQSPGRGGAARPGTAGAGALVRWTT